MTRNTLTPITTVLSAAVLSVGLVGCSEDKTPTNQPEATKNSISTPGTQQQPVTGPTVDTATLKVPRSAQGAVQDLHPVESIGCQLPPGGMSKEQANSALGKTITAKDHKAFKTVLAKEPAKARTELTWAVPVIVKGGCTELLKAALETDFNPWQGEEMTRKTLAFDAIRSGEPELVQTLLKNTNPNNAFTEYATEFLGYSFCFQPWESSAALIKAGGKLTAPEPGQPPTLIEAARCGQLASIAGGLKTLGDQMTIDEFFVHVIAATPSSQNTPKVKTAHLTAIKYLREQGAKTDQRFEITYPDAADKTVTTKTTAQELANNPAIWPEVAQILN